MEEIQVNSLVEALQYTIMDLGYDLNNPRIHTLVELILFHVERMDDDPDAYKNFTEKYGARAYVNEKGKSNLIEEMISDLGEGDAEDITALISLYTERFLDGSLQKSR